MMKQKSSPQKKFQEEMTAKELVKTDIKNITEQEFRITVIRLITGLEKIREDSRESIATEIKELKNSHDELRNVVNEVQNQLDALTARMEEVEERIIEIENNIMANEEAEKKRDKKILDHEGKIRELSDSMKCNNIHVIRVPEEEERKGQKVYLNKL